MRAYTATVVANETVAAGLARLVLAAPALSAAGPGQWLAVRRPDALSILAQPLPITALDPRGGTAEVTYQTGTMGTMGAGDALADWLEMRPAGAAVEVLGPWGRALPSDERARHVILLARGTALLDLLALCRMLVDRGVAVVVLHDAATASALLPPSLLPTAVEYRVATADGTVGTPGSALDLLPPLLPWADALYAALPPELYPPLRDMVHRGRLRVRRGFATVLAAAPLACYAAACDGCAVPLRNGQGLLCKDGPAFDLLEIL